MALTVQISPDKGELIINAGTFTASNNGSGNIFAQGQGGTSGGTAVVSGVATMVRSTTSITLMLT